MLGDQDLSSTQVVHTWVIVSRGDWLGKPAKFKEPAYCSCFYVESTVTWPRPCTQLQTNMAAVGTSSTDFGCLEKILMLYLKL